jgi:hypothetical protein
MHRPTPLNCTPFVRRAIEGRLFRWDRLSPIAAYTRLESRQAENALISTMAFRGVD